MNRNLAPLLGKSCLVYLDDVLIFSKTPEEHVQHLKEALTILREQSLYCKLSKCKFGMREVKYVGQLVSEEGLRPNPAKVQVLKDWPEPANRDELQCFLGLAQYFSKFICAYATISACLQALIRPKSDWKWTDSCAAAFREIKARLTSAPVLALPDPTRPYEVVTDACQTGIGAVLLQDGRPVAFTGRLLTPAETRYTTTDQELPAVVYAVSQWRCYLQGAQHDFTLVTDHHPNTYFATQPTLSRRQTRWSEKMQEYHFKWEYRPGKHNVADPVSRSPGLTMMANCMHALGWPVFEWHERSPRMVSGLAAAICSRADFFMRMHVNAASWHANVQTRAQARVPAESPAQPESAPEPTPPLASSGDEHTRPAVYGEHPSDQRSLIAELRDAYLQDPVFGDPDDATVRHKHLRAANGLWYRASVIAVPASPAIKRQIMSELHDSPYAGHGGEYRTVQLVRRYFWWPSLDNDCRAYVKGCTQCQRNKASTRPYAGLLHQHEVAAQKWDQVSMDFITHLPRTPRGHDSIMVVVDTLSKLVHFVPCKMTDTAEDIAML